MKILINTPILKHGGGVANHYRGLKDYWNENVLYNEIGKRSSKKGSGIYWIFWDILKFSYRLLTFNPNIVVVNPSLNNRALKRDFLFLNIAKFFGFKVAIFFHGFNLDNVNKVNPQWMHNNLSKASVILVLASAFKEHIKTWCSNVPIVNVSTKVDDKLIKDFNINYRNGEVKNILFLTRVVKEKGIYETIETFKILQSKYPYLTLTIVGDGDELNNVKKKIEKTKLKNIRITGALSGKELAAEFVKGDLYLFLSYTEGMPTSVLEAMSFGLPIVTRKVGGLADFFDERMGFISKSYDPNIFANAIIGYINDKNLTKETSKFNHNYAINNFLASKVAFTFEKILKSYI